MNFIRNALSNNFYHYKKSYIIIKNRKKAEIFFIIDI